MKKSLPLILSLVLSSANATGFNSSNSAALVPLPAATGGAVVPQDDAYYTYKLKDKDIELIYTEDNIKFAKHALMMEEQIHNDYEKFFGWKLDETLYVGLISANNQIANGFSTQFPNNRQINYIGGSINVDYFSNTSWLDVLIYHETTHNYQANVKASAVSQTLHSVIGNGTILFPVPWFVVPNMVQNSFMLEGNAVLNESWHGTGGRLYSGRFKAMMMLQAKAGNITPDQMYNSKLGFPYGGDIYYQIGGFYNLFLAEKYGTKTVDKFFYNNSSYWALPFFTNFAMEDTVGRDFETTMKDYSDYYAKLAENLVEADGEKIASTQFYSPLNGNADEIFFVTNETGYRMPQLVVVNKENESVDKTRDSWMAGRVLKVDDEYYTQGSNHTSPIKITQGLFSNNAFIKDGTQGKMIQGYLSDGRAVYFDVESSYDQPQLYVGSEYIGYTNSSVIIDKDDNIYYFANKNKGKEKILYKNKTPLYTFQGFYGIVSDVDSNGAVYFIANSELGSTLYRYKDGKVTRASKADNILEARLLNDNEVLVSAVSDRDYYFVKNKLETIDEAPFNTKLFFEDKEYYKQYTSENTTVDVESVDLSDSYYSLFDIHYSGTNFAIGQATNEAIVGSLNIAFGDPLTQNSANVFVGRDDSNVTIAGAGYENTQYILQYSISGYGVIDDNDRNDTRSSGVIASAHLPFLQTGYYSGSLDASYFQDYDTAEREPLTGSLNMSISQNFGISMYSNFTDAFSVYGVKERDDLIVGGSYLLSHDLGREFYVSLGAKYSITDLNMNNTGAQLDARGVKVSSSGISDRDRSTIVMPTLDSGSSYWKEVGYAEGGISKVFNLSSYWFTFPLSLQRESLYAKYRYYDMKRFDATRENVSEISVGLRMDVVVLNNFPLPFSLEYYHNDNKNITDNEDQVKFILGASF